MPTNLPSIPRRRLDQSSLQLRYVLIGDFNRIHTGWGPRSIAFSWFISGLTMVYGRYNYS